MSTNMSSKSVFKSSTVAKSYDRQAQVKMTSKKLKLLLFGVVVVLIPLFMLSAPFVGYANGDDHAEDVPHDASPQVQVLPIEGDDDFVGDGHTDHTHALTIMKPWYQDAQWWTLLIISLFLMSLLSFGVYRYLQVKD